MPGGVLSQRVCVGGRLRHDTQRGHQTVPKTEGTAAPRSPKTERRPRARRARATPHPLAVSPGCPKIGCWPRVGCITPHGGCQVTHTVPVLCYNTDNPRRTLGEGAGRSRFSFFWEKWDGDLGLSAVSEVGRGQRSSLAPTSAQPMLSVLGKATLRLPARGPGGTELGKGSATGPGGPQRPAARGQAPIAGNAAARPRLSPKSFPLLALAALLEAPLARQSLRSSLGATRKRCPKGTRDPKISTTAEWPTPARYGTVPSASRTQPFWQQHSQNPKSGIL